MQLNQTGSPLDRNERNKLNKNWETISKEFNNVVDTVSEQAYSQIVDAAKLTWKEPVASQNDLPGNAQEGDTRQARDTGKVYRFNGSAWVEIQQVDAGPVNEVDSRLTAQLAQTENDLKQREINVRQPPYNLKGDGTDESSKIQLILDLAKERPIKLYFPDGVYGVANYLLWRGNTTIRMSQKAVIKRVGNTNKILQNGEHGNLEYANGYDRESNLTLIGGTIDLNSQDYPLADDKSITCISIGHGANVLIEGVTINNGQNGHYFQISSSKDVVIRDCRFTNQRNTGIESIYEVIQIEIMTSIGFPSFGAYDLTPCQNITIEDCVFEDCIRGIGTHGDGMYETENVVYSNNIKIRNNTFKNMKSMVIGLVGYKNVLVEGNVSEGSLMHGFYILNCEDLKIINNYMKNISWSGIQATNVYNATFRDNEFYELCLSIDSERSGIRCYNVNDTVFENNKVHSATPNYQYAHYFSDESNTLQIINHRYNPGIKGTIYGSDHSHLTSLITGNGRKLLFEGDLSVVGDEAQLNDDIRLYSMIIVVANNNSGNGNMVSMMIPKDMYNISATASRFRIITGTGGSESFQIDFSTPSTIVLRVDAVNGNGHIRKIIGII